MQWSLWFHCNLIWEGEGGGPCAPILPLRGSSFFAACTHFTSGTLFVVARCTPEHAGRGFQAMFGVTDKITALMWNLWSLRELEGVQPHHLLWAQLVAAEPCSGNGFGLSSDQSSNLQGNVVSLCVFSDQPTFMAKQ